MPRALSLITASFVGLLNLAAQPGGHSMKATEAMVAYYETADHWALRGVVLLSLGEKWHPVGSRMVLQALRDKDRRLRAYGIEALLRTDPAQLPAAVSKELVEELVSKQLQKDNRFFRSRVQEVLKRLAPAAGAEGPAAWSSWWSRERDRYAPAAWREPEQAGQAESGHTVVSTFVERAFDLRHAGLDLAICIDSTGSMQPTIDRARDALTEIIVILQGIAPRFRMGLVHYRDFGDFKDGARLLVPLTANVKQVRDKLGKIVAGGGGDIPERVEKGLEIALSPRMKWKTTTNKVVILIGDSPPHPEAEDRAIRLARDAHEKPAAVVAGRGAVAPVTGVRAKEGKQEARPFLISTIAVGRGPARQFRAIAKAGGGSFVQLPGRGRGARRGRGGSPAPEGRGGADGSDGSAGSENSDDDPTRRIVRQILMLSFGERFKEQMRAFVDIYFQYQREKVFSR